MINPLMVDKRRFRMVVIGGGASDHMIKGDFNQHDGDEWWLTMMADDYGPSSTYRWTIFNQVDG